jgi:hypothetical protein
MALNLNPTTFAEVVEKASHDAANHPRWLQAIARAIVEISDNPWIERNPNGHGVIIGSTSGEAYSANGTCSCKAFEYGQPCYHRAIARIVRLCDEKEAAQRQIVCQQPDNLCELHNPCPEHAPVAAAYLAQEARLTRKIAAQRATAQLNELFA